MVGAIRAKLLLCLLLVVSLLVLVAVPVSAATDPFGKLDCSGEKSEAAVCGKPKGDPVNSTLHNITNIIAIIAGVAAIFVIIAAGIRMISSGSSPDEVAKAKRGILLAVVGLIVILFARTIINIVLRGI